MKIDIHSHFYPRAYLESVLRLTEGADDTWTTGVRRLLATKIAPDPRMTDINAQIDEMDRTGVNVKALSLSIPHVYFDDEATAVALARIANDAIADLCARHPDRFRGLAVLPLPHADAALRELGRAIDDLGLHGVTLGANINGRHLDDERFLPLYAEIDRRDLVIVLHPMIPPGQEELGEYDLSAVVGYVMDSTAGVLRLVYRGIFERHPNLNVVVPHLGGMLPFIWNRIQRSYDARPEIRGHITQPPEHYLKRLYYDSVNFHRPAWQCAIDTYGLSQIVFGSDYPLNLGSMEQAIECIDALDITEEERSAIYAGRAKRLLHWRD